MGFFTQPAVRSRGKVGRRGGMNAQWLVFFDEVEIAPAGQSAP